MFTGHVGVEPDDLRVLSTRSLNPLSSWGNHDCVKFRPKSVSCKSPLVGSPFAAGKATIRGDGNFKGFCGALKALFPFPPWKIGYPPGEFLGTLCPRGFGRCLHSRCRFVGVFPPRGVFFPRVFPKCWPCLHNLSWGSKTLYGFPLNKSGSTTYNTRGRLIREMISSKKSDSERPSQAECFSYHTRGGGG